MIVMMGSIALPLTNGFVGEFLLLSGVYSYNSYFGLFAGLTIILGSVYMLNAYQKTMLGEISPASADFKELSGYEKNILFIAAALVIIMGVFPKPIMDIAEPAVQQLLSEIK
jgi:NADH-quinone oxidoreductase subunit M